MHQLPVKYLFFFQYRFIHPDGSLVCISRALKGTHKKNSRICWYPLPTLPAFKIAEDIILKEKAPLESSNSAGLTCPYFLSRLIPPESLSGWNSLKRLQAIPGARKLP
jgi:hypothetical protein